MFDYIPTQMGFHSDTLGQTKRCIGVTRPTLKFGPTLDFEENGQEKKEKSLIS